MDFFKVSHRIIKILVSLSLLSLLLSLLPLLFQSLRPFFNEFSVNKYYVFLFCNGLMVFIAKNSGVHADSSSHQLKDLDIVAAPPVINSLENGMVADSPEQEEEVEEEEEKRIIVADSQAKNSGVHADSSSHQFKYLDIVAALPVINSPENGMVADSPEQEEVEEEEEKRMIVADSQEENEVADIDDTEVEDEVVTVTEKNEEDECEEEEHGVEELNKKCDDFIRKMKAAFCSEPR
ncbi:uncharacterized protein LOC129304137 [Prosopis cineraria]|uniref:uncharacterized protein LOC129304137 n=1 Tax=Prosopis cineraria TaxID=364024 RepID=UPI00240FFF9B|nr:uncharacterized protein LOC129304137 [Prosopis cineraria]